jgi:hypothetical protein
MNDLLVLPDSILPLASGKARLIQLISSGYLSLEEGFGHDSSYNLTTIGEDLSDRKVYEKYYQNLVNINKLYEKSILLMKNDNYKYYINSWKKYSYCEYISTYKIFSSCFLRRSN